jgi:hypothetical protein
MKKNLLTHFSWGNWKEIAGDLLTIFFVGLVLASSLMIYEYGMGGSMQKVIAFL